MSLRAKIQLVMILVLFCTPSCALFEDAKAADAATEPTPEQRKCISAAREKYHEDNQKCIELRKVDAECDLDTMDSKLAEKETKCLH